MMLANQIQRNGEMIQSGFNQSAQAQWQPITPASMGYPIVYPPVMLQPPPQL